MRTIWKLFAAFAIVGGFTACKKDKGPDGPTDFSGGCEAVDLGITTKDGKPLKWASYKVGALNVDGRGFYFAWGETKQKSDYNWLKEGDYKWGVYDGEAWPKYGMTKYTADVEGCDGLKTLLPGDDPATANWGTKWRTPTLDEIKELLDETKCEWTWDAAKKGYTIKGLATGKSIFLPAAGYRYGSALKNAGTNGYYWSSSVNVSHPSTANDFIFISDDRGWSYDRRYYGQSVRAVTEY